MFRGWNRRFQCYDMPMTIGVKLRDMRVQILGHRAFRGYKVDDLLQWTIDHPRDKTNTESEAI
jgi:hypothetical protein